MKCASSSAIAVAVLLGTFLHAARATRCDPRHAISTGVAFSCGLGYGPDIKCWGANHRNQLDVPTTLQTAAPKFLMSGGEHSCALTQDDSAICWGNNQGGCLDVPADKRWSYVSPGYHFTCGIEKDTQQGHCWGDNAYKRTEIPSGYKWKNVYAAANHACGVTEEGYGRCWGFPTPLWQLCCNEPMKGAQIDVPTYYPGAENFTGWEYICGGTDFSCGLLKNGTF